MGAPHDLRAICATYPGQSIDKFGNVTLHYLPMDPEPPGMPEADVQRIAKAVDVEMERRAILDEYARLTRRGRP